MEQFLTWLGENWEYIGLVFMVLDKLVALSPSKYDDIIVDVIYRGLLRLLGLEERVLGLKE